MNESVRISVTVEDGETTITSSGQMDLHNSREFGEALKAASRSSDGVTVDIRRTTFVDTAVLAYIAAAGRTLIGRNKRLKIITTEGTQPLRTLQITGFSALVDIIIEPASN